MQFVSEKKSDFRAAFSCLSDGKLLVILLNVILRSRPVALPGKDFGDEDLPKKINTNIKCRRVIN